MGRKRIEPKKGIKYIFKFTNQKTGLTHPTTLIFEGVKDNGRLEFYNVETKTYTSMPDKRFSYIHRFNLVREETFERGIKEPPKTAIEDKPRVIVEDENYELMKAVKWLSSLSAEHKIKISQAINRPFNSFLADMKSFANSEGDNVVGPWGDYYKALDVVGVSFSQVVS